MKHALAQTIDGSVLVADDHDVVRFGLSQLIQRSFQAQRVLEADCFDGALQLIGTENLKLVVCDLAMPGLEGPARLAYIRRRRPDVKLVVLSGIAERAAVLEALQAGVHGYLVKTTSNDDLIKNLAYVLSGQVYVPPLVADIGDVRPVEPDVCDDAEASGTVAANIAGARLSPRQLQVLGGLVRGLSNKEIARELELAEGTIKMHVGAVLRALGASNRAHAAALGHQLLS
jgi:DNA-binding NarL/FixJ family response regulator